MSMMLLQKIRGLSVPTRKELHILPSYFSRKEWVFFMVLLGCLIILTTLLLGRINTHFMVAVPAYGGSLTEGIIGTPRFINPVLAVSDADKDLSVLIFSGLMKKTPDGKLIPDLAESYTISDDGLTYTFILRNNLTFHDGTPLTTDDIAFTIAKIIDTSLKSPLQVEWEGVSVNVIDTQTISFSLRQRFSTFLENTTIGILPKHIWEPLPIEEWAFNAYNETAIGAGPYHIDRIKRTASHVPESYKLESFSHYALGKPYIQRLEIIFYENEESLIGAYESGNVESISAISPEQTQLLEHDADLYTTSLPRLFGLFFNQNQAPLFADTTLIGALEFAIDKERIVREVLYGYGTAIDSPVPKTFFALDETENIFSPDEALRLLANNGWVKGEDGILNKKGSMLSFSLSTADVPELKKTAEIIKENLESIGVQVELKIFEVGVLNQNIIRPRKYDVLLFGQIISTTSDLFAFWHSSQRNDPGLNIALYTNSKADTYLETAQGTLSETGLSELYRKFETEVIKDHGALFLYSPSFIYIMPKKVEGVTIDHIVEPSDRFKMIHTWYIEQDNVWKIFS